MRNNGKNITEQEKNEIVKLYTVDKLSLRGIADIFNTNYNRISEILKSKGERIITKKKLNNRLIESFFDKIDSIEKAYILGFLYADGCNSQKRGLVSIQVAEQDIEILEYIKKCLQADSPLKENKYNKKRWPHRQTPFTLHIWNRYMSTRVAELGCVERKSLILKFPTEEQIPKELLPHFIRGYFDGDGSVIKSKSRYRDGFIFHLNIMGTLSFLTNLKEYIETSTGALPSIKMDTRANRNPIYYLTIQKQSQMLIFLEKIYNFNIEFGLSRKIKRFQELKQFCDEARKILITPNDRVNIINLYSQRVLNIKEIANKYKISGTYVYKILKDMGQPLL